VFFSRMSAMLQSRVGTSDALGLIRDTFKGKIQEVAGRLLAHVESGADFATAVERVGSPDFPEATVALIMAGSRSGETWRAIKDASEFENELHKVKQGASKGLWMGIGSFIFAGLVTVVSTVYVGPEIMSSPMIASAAKNGAVDIGWITTAGYVTGYTIGALLLFGFVAWAFAFIGRAIAPTQTDKVILKVPFYKDLILSRNNFIVLYGLALLIRSGVRTEEALRLAAEGAPRGALRTDLVNATNAVKTGKQWPRLMETLHPTDKAALLSATDREQVATTLGALATQYRELYAQRLAAFVPAINLLAALFMSIAGGILFGQAILPMLMASSGMF
jgi:general secretion pathway protein F